MSNKNINLIRIKKSNEELHKYMKIHYSQPKGFVGRQLIYLVEYNNIIYGAIAGGSATLHLPGRNEFFNNTPLNNIVNNIFYHVHQQDKKYPLRNFTTKIIQEWRNQVILDWCNTYKDEVLGFETLVELPRTGDLYKKDKWIETGITKGYTCKRIGGKSTESWSGKRVWDTKNLRPKRVFCRLL